MCRPKVSRQYLHMAGCNCGCCGCGCSPPFRRFFTAREEMERPIIYRDQLEKELAGVQEQISELKEA